jgi:hypothetical protein
MFVTPILNELPFSHDWIGLSSPHFLDTEHVSDFNVFAPTAAKTSPVLFLEFVATVGPPETKIPVEALWTKGEAESHWEIWQTGLAILTVANSGEEQVLEG